MCVCVCVCVCVSVREASSSPVCVCVYVYIRIYQKERHHHPYIYIYIYTHTRNNTIYTFNQYNRIKGNNINVGYIDTAMVIIPFILCTNIKWKLDIYEADGYYIKGCIDNNRDKHVYSDKDLSYYSFLQ